VEKTMYGVIKINGKRIKTAMSATLPKQAPKEAPKISCSILV
jgi:hypothetical protein